MQLTFVFVFLVIAISLIVAFVVVKRIIHLSADPNDFKDLYPDIKNEIREIDIAELPFWQMGGTINDASGVNRTPVYGIVKVNNEEDIKNALLFANQNKLKISIAGARHSMGGQAFASNALVLDMRNYNKMHIDVSKKMLTVESGALWHDVQIFLNEHGLAVIAMQSFDLATVGGTIAVNAHGMDHRYGGVTSTVKSMRVMLADGSIVKTSREQNPEIFHSVNGGYGLIGIILESEIEVMENHTYVEEIKVIKTENFLPEYEKILNDKDIHLFYARLSTAPISYLKKMIVSTYRRVDEKPVIAQLTPETSIWFRRLAFNLSRNSFLGMEFKWYGEKNIQPKLQKYPATRNQIMHRSYTFLRNKLKNNTDVLQEYFFPQEKLHTFLDGLKTILKNNKILTRNVEIRSVYNEKLFLDYSGGNWVGVVLYLNMNVNQLNDMMRAHSQLIDFTDTLGGKFYMPYLLSATREQIERSYPGFNKFLELKNKLDPDNIFTSEFFKKYGNLNPVENSEPVLAETN